MLQSNPNPPNPLRFHVMCIAVWMGSMMKRDEAIRFEIHKADRSALRISGSTKLKLWAWIKSGGHISFLVLTPSDHLNSSPSPVFPGRDQEGLQSQGVSFLRLNMIGSYWVVHTRSYWVAERAASRRYISLDTLWQKLNQLPDRIFEHPSSITNTAARRLGEWIHCRSKLNSSQLKCFTLGTRVVVYTSWKSWKWNC